VGENSEAGETRERVCRSPGGRLMAKPLPPYGQNYRAARPDPGPVVATGPGSWTYGRAWSTTPRPVMVLPDGADPAAFTWPASRQAALVHERGRPDDSLLTKLATQLLIAGSPFVVALRYASRDRPVRTMFFYGEPEHGA
jgi:hypothetical protein